MYGNWLARRRRAFPDVDTVVVQDIYILEVVNMNCSIHLLRVLSLSCVILAACATPSWSIVIRHDVDPQAYLDFGALPAFDSVGLITSRAFAGSGVLIADQWVLTAAHMVDRGNPKHYTFTIGGETYSGLQRIAHDNWNGSLLAGWDIGLLQLDRPVTNITAATRYTGFDDIGMTAAFVGYGRTGTGETGALSGTFGTKRAAENVLDKDGTFLGGSQRISLADFDSPTTAQSTQATAMDQDTSASPTSTSGSTRSSTSATVMAMTTGTRAGHRPDAAADVSSPMPTSSPNPPAPPSCSWA